MDTLAVVAAVTVLAATIWMPVLQIYSSSMAPTLGEVSVPLFLTPPQIFTCVNISQTWSISLTKQNVVGDPLDGAIFALYSTNAADGIAVPEGYAVFPEGIATGILINWDSSFFK